MMFEIRSEVEPVFTTKDLGDVYVIDPILYHNFLIM